MLPLKSSKITIQTGGGVACSGFFQSLDLNFNSWLSTNNLKSLLFKPITGLSSGSLTLILTVTRSSLIVGLPLISADLILAQPGWAKQVVKRQARLSLRVKEAVVVDQAIERRLIFIGGMAIGNWGRKSQDLIVF